MSFRFRRRGASHIEFALVAPVLILVTFAIVEYGWMFYQRAFVLDAARRGCRAGAVVHPLDDFAGAVETVTLAQLELGGVDCDVLDCNVDTNTDGDSPKEILLCNVQVEYRAITGLLPTPDNVTAGYIYHFERQK
jgi:hypothetical protein